MAASPGNDIVAAQALDHAVGAGDWALALKAARSLEERAALPPDGRFLLIADAVRSGDWEAAARQIDLVEKEELFAFTLPVLRAWLAVGSGEGDPTAPLRGVKQGPAAVYAAEHMPLVLVVTGRLQDAEDLIRITDAMGGRAQRLRLGIAARLANSGKREQALALLAGDDPPLVAARKLIEAGRPLPGALDGAAAGIAELYVRLALDLQLQELSDIALGFARLATFLAPENGQAWLVAAELLTIDGQHAAALPLLDRVAAEDPYAAAAEEQRLRILVAGGEMEAALAAAQAAVRQPLAKSEDWVLLGEMYGEMERFPESADAFGRALALHGDDSGVPQWALWLMRGSALEQAGEWQEAKAALYEAYRLAPSQPFVLNYLGYSQLERRENMAAAEQMIREAHRLAPDNAAITDSLGWALYLRGEVDEAIGLLETAAQGEPADVEINEHLGDAYYSAGRRLEARFAWKAALVYAEGEDEARLRAKLETGLTPQLAAR